MVKDLNQRFRGADKRIVNHMMDVLNKSFRNGKYLHLSKWKQRAFAVQQVKVYQYHLKQRKNKSP